MNMLRRRPVTDSASDANGDHLRDTSYSPNLGADARYLVKVGTTRHRKRKRQVTTRNATELQLCQRASDTMRPLIFRSDLTVRNIATQKARHPETSLDSLSDPNRLRIRLQIPAIPVLAHRVS